ncbi:FAD-binding and (Fe-S)-binding domain-containing protein [Labrys wisconsinensis]|uniref:FAD/FMN-containing dehydrogenase/Fe-S oxidoreductase n=1 Tax=Labrys wisconsinensis TaxID=425677 RepID=A0ABU0JAU5_9HYPH|nr:FAD-binding and (Fe-S)-binding domain-containing protein [Labrys wisconsinensis]MDQ0471395.1 FAD/FMN-containing dehydrogenase/Fe-S oxidoreductase [Labrys wisconsinensis]
MPKHHSEQGSGAILESRLRSEIRGDVLFDVFSRGRYATDASIYQVTPRGIVIPRDMDEAVRAVALARQAGVCVLARGGGTSQSGQTVNDALVIDTSRHLNRILSLDVQNRRCRVEPGIVLDDLNRQLAPHGLWFPVDISTASRATIGGMAANNSCGGRSLRYGTMRDNVLSIEATLADGSDVHFGEVRADLAGFEGPAAARDLFRDLLAIGEREADEVRARFPRVQRRVGGYNIDALVPGPAPNNMAHILVGSEGTLAFIRAVELKLWPALGPRGVGACHFGSFHQAMDAAQHLVKLGPIAVELIDRTMLELAGDIPVFVPTLKQFVRGTPEAILLVEFAEGAEENARRLKQLAGLMGDLGFAWDHAGAQWGGVVDVLDPALQHAITEVRQSGLNIMMSMKQDGKPISFVEDCAVELADLAAYTDRLTRVFEKHGTTGTWYAHASVGCLHVRPVLNLKLDRDVKTMRAIAEEAFALVRDYKGSHSGEHGDGIVRSEFHEAMFGPRLARAFEAIKDRFDPAGLFNPGRIVRAPRMDDRRLFRYGPGYEAKPMQAALAWSEYSGAGGGFQGAVEMCNNNGACRKLAGGAMCPSYRVTRNERDATRGRANTLRLAITGQLGPNAFTSDEMAETMKLCVSCKGCKRECPTGVDMARMKIEVLAARVQKHGLPMCDRIVGYLPRYAPWASTFAWLANLRDGVAGLAAVSEALFGLTAKRRLPRWRADSFAPASTSFGDMGGREVVLMADTFNRYYERETLEAAIRVLVAGGYRVHTPAPADGSKRALCCGRTFLSVGLVEEARREARRLLQTFAPFAARGVPIIGLEPSCLFTLRDELPAMLPGQDAERLAQQAMLFEEFLAREDAAGRLALPLEPIGRKALLHGHCHQKAFGAMAAVEKVLRLVPELDVTTIDSGCCGMAGAFGYGRDTYAISMAMAELSLLPAVRKADADTIIIADGTSCRGQIQHGAGREAIHVARALSLALGQSSKSPDDRRWSDGGGLRGPPSEVLGQMHLRQRTQSPCQ